MDARSVVLSLAMANGFALSALILTLRANRAANALLAALVAVFTLRLGPHALGFAGLYDAHRWLTFLPLDLSLGFGPLLYAYVTTRLGAPPRRLWPHLAPAALQLAYWCAAFALPLGAKWAWYTGPHLHLVAPLGLAASLAIAGAYLALAWGRVTGAPGWLRAVLWLFAAMLALSAAAAAVSWVRPLSYRERFPLMLALAALAYALGLIGWRFGDRPLAAPRARGAGPDYAAIARIWTDQARAGGWAREEGLTAAELSQRLGVSPRTLSRGLAEGAGLNVNAFLNGLRVATFTEALDGGDERDLLDLALEAGFASKASFNRAFRAVTGVTPSAYRGAARRKFRQIAAAAEAGAPSAAS